ncbi:hypothetical protein Syun_028344 [Stephania yunnanensis]|uniref:Uncharacterized protein n=1 Tax=Stephania yunnanensis TaxID=152371 RepID=A0AAP0HLU2_9MAGN
MALQTMLGPLLPSPSLGRDRDHAPAAAGDSVVVSTAITAASSSSSSSAFDMARQRSSCESSEDVQLAMFNNNRPLWVCDPTELKARSILCLAARETEERPRKMGPTKKNKKKTQWSVAVPKTVHPQFLCVPGVSIKKSLQHFFKRRRARIHASSSCAAAHNL